MSSEWRPIDSAPKDGTPILGYRFDRPEIARIGVVFWLPDAWRFREENWSGGAGGIPMERPTHWMPLPLPPARDAASGE